MQVVKFTHNTQTKGSKKMTREEMMIEIFIIFKSLDDEEKNKLIDYAATLNNEHTKEVV